MEGQQDSDFINKKVLEIIQKLSLYKNLKNTVGGGISNKTFNNDFLINNIVPKLSCIETRNVILPSSCIILPESLKQALDFEKSYLNFKLSKNKIFSRFDEERFSTLMKRG